MAAISTMAAAKRAVDVKKPTEARAREDRICMGRAGAVMASPNEGRVS
jgi:hypothetical protein